MSYAVCVIYVKNAINDIFDNYYYDIMLAINMSIWVSKEALGPQECSPLSKNILNIGFTSEKLKNMMI